MMDIKRIIRDNYEQLYANEVDKLEVDTCLGPYNQPRLNHEEIE